jgi:chromate transporter
MTVLHLFLLVLSISVYSFGGASVVLAGLERELVQTGLLSPHDFGVAVAIGNATPGPLAAYITAVGQAMAGPWGALFALLPLVLVSLVAIIVIRFVPSDWFQRPLMRSVLRGMVPYAAALTLLVSCRVAIGNGLQPLGLMIAAGAAGARLFKVPAVAIVLAGITVGAFFL